VHQAFKRALVPPEGTASATGARPRDMQLLSLAWRCAHEAEQRAGAPLPSPPLAEDYEAASLTPVCVDRWELPGQISAEQGEAARCYVYEHGDVLASLMAAGVDDFITKPLGVGAEECALCLICKPGGFITQQTIAFQGLFWGPCAGPTAKWPV
jgi:hypothetical protein